MEKNHYLPAPSPKDTASNITYQSHIAQHHSAHTSTDAHNVTNLTHASDAPSTHNTNKQQNQLPTPINPNKLAHFLQGYSKEETNYLIQGFTYGFYITQTQQFTKCQIAKNHNSATQKPQIVQDMLSKELEAGRIQGPFSQPPFHNFGTKTQKGVGQV